MERDETARTGRARIDYIDGLRALAVLGVIVAHCATHSATPSGAARHALLEGAHGVDLFFVLSGFCLAFPTLRRWRSGPISFDVVGFFTKRLVRICPPFYLATLLFVALAAVSALLHHPLLELPAHPFDLLSSLLFLDGHVQLVNTSFWTLMVEFRWYFAFPLLLWVWLRSPRAFFAIAAACVVLYHLTRAHSLDVGTLPGFMSGIVAADLFAGARLGDRAARRLKRWALPLIPLGAAFGVAVEGRAWIPGFAFADVPWPFQPTVLGWQLAVFGLVVACGERRELRALLSLRALVAIGIASYAIYLVHEPLIALLGARVPGWVGLAVAAAAALAAGFAFWAVAERPFTTGPVRGLLLERLAPLVDRAAALAGLPRRFTAGLPEAPPRPQTHALAEALY